MAPCYSVTTVFVAGCPAISRLSSNHLSIPPILRSVARFSNMKVWDEIICPFPNWRGTAVEVWGWINDSIAHFVMYVTHVIKGDPRHKHISEKNFAMFVIHNLVSVFWYAPVKLRFRVIMLKHHHFRDANEHCLIDIHCNFNVCSTEVISHWPIQRSLPALNEHIHTLWVI